MGLTVNLAQQAQIDVRDVGALHLIALADTEAFLDTCEAAGVLVLGVEGFYLDTAQARPEMDAIADFSRLTGYEESIFEARCFIKAVGRPGMLFDFALSKEGSA